MPDDASAELTAAIASAVDRSLVRHLGNLRLEHQPSYKAVLAAAAEGDFGRVSTMLSKYANLRNVPLAQRMAHLNAGEIENVRGEPPRLSELEERLWEQFTTDFRGTPAWLRATEDSNHITEARYDLLARRFVTEWCTTNLANRFQPDQDQVAAIAHVGSHALLAARAGSGKTSTMIARAIFLMRGCGVAAQEILMLAFNREAAATLRARMRDLLPGEPQPHIMTFHALAFRLVHPGEDLLYDESDSRRPLAQYIQSVIDTFIGDPATQRRVRDAMLTYFTKDWARLESRGDTLPVADAVAYRRSLQLESIKGDFVRSGGEKLIANILFGNGICGTAHEPESGYYGYEHDVRWNGRNYKPDFSIYDADKKLRVVIEYFGWAGHAEYDKGSEAKRAYWRARPDVCFLEYFRHDIAQPDFETRLLDQLTAAGIPLRRLTDEEIWERIKARAIDRFTEAVTTFIGRARQRNKSGDDLRSDLERQHLDTDPDVTKFVDLAAEALDAYLASMGADAKEDFSGLMWKAVKHVRDGGTQFGQKGRIDGDLRELRHVIVDEFQDFSLMFFELLRQILEFAPEAQVMAVGDDWQAINEFAGSSTEYFTGFEDFFPGAARLQLTTNRRSAPEIVRLGNALMEGHGSEARYVKTTPGTIRQFDPEDFVPSLIEIERFGKYDRSTPALLRLIQEHLAAGRDVAVLSRRRKSKYAITVDGKSMSFDGIAPFGAWVSEFIGVETPELLRFGSIHGFKGEEADAVVLIGVDARSFPLLHSTWPLFQVFGDSLESITEAERRLFYVGLSRARQHLDLLVDINRPTPFWAELERTGLAVAASWSDVDAYRHATDTGRIELRVYNREVRAFDESKRQLKEDDFSYRGSPPHWSKVIDAGDFDPDAVLSRPWAKHLGIRVEAWQGRSQILSHTIPRARRF